MKKILIPLLIFVLPIIALSQDESKWNVQLSGGPIVSFGDVTDHSLFSPSFYNDDAWKTGGAAVLGYSLSNSVGFRMQLKYGEIGRSNNFLARHFQGTIMDASLQFKLNINELFNHNLERSFNTYALLGGGVSSWDTEDNDSGPINHDPFNINARTNKPFIPAGIGLSFRISDHFDLNLEGLVNITNSDLLDQQEEGAKFDKYAYASFGLTYKFGLRSRRGRSSAKERKAEPTRPAEAKTQEKAQEPEEEKSDPVEVTLDSDMPAEIDKGESFAATIRIVKGNLDETATLRQLLPEGVELQPLSVGAGEYNFMNGVVTINWQKLPKNQPTIKIIYMVKTENIERGTYPMNGVFTYTQNSLSKQINFKNSLKVNAPEESERQEEKQFEKQNYETQDRIQPSGVVYRVQIRAKYQAKMSKSELANRFNFNEPIYENYHNGYYIYNVGNFSTIDAAENKREELVNQHGVNDAFVTAFKNGKRIEIEELDRF